MEAPGRGAVDLYEKYFGGTNARHTLRIRALGERNPSSTGNRVEVDGVAVVR